MPDEKRLIDATKLKRIIQESIDESDFDLFKQVMNQMCSLLDKAPTVDAVEVLSGHWVCVDDGVLIGNGKHFECSICGIWQHRGRLSKYCPNCGAKMDVEEK
jgi:hypothetical protein